MNEITNVEVLKSEVAPVIAQASAIVIATPEQYSGASDFLKSVKAAQKKVVEFFAPLKTKAHEAHKAITTTESTTLKPLTEAEATIKRKMLAYATEQDRIRQEAERKLQAEADAQARKEREALEKKAASMKTPEKQQEYMEAAAAVVAPVVTVASTTPVIAGQSIKKQWRAYVKDVKLVPREFMVVNESALQAFARATKGSVQVSGVEFREEPILSSTSR